MSAMMFFNTKSMRQSMTDYYKLMEITDVALTYYHEKENFAVLNLKELLIQLAHWKKEKMQVMKTNVRQKEINGQNVYLFVVQPESKKLLAKLDICPFSASLGFMVAGVGYVCKSRDILDLVIRYIGVEGSTTNPLFDS